MDSYNRKRKLYVGGFGDEVDELTLAKAFAPFGEIVDVTIPSNHETQEKRGFGFVEFENKEDAEAALDNMHEAEINSRILIVNFARPQKPTLQNDKPFWVTDEWLKQYAYENPKPDQEDNHE